MYDGGRPDQRKRPGSLWLNYSRAIRRREIFGLLGPVFVRLFCRVIYGREIWSG
jgi:hypothetical protein